MTITDETLDEMLAQLSEVRLDSIGNPVPHFEGRYNHRSEIVEALHGKPSEISHTRNRTQIFEYFGLELGSTYRPFEEQVQTVCEAVTNARLWGNRLEANKVLTVAIYRGEEREFVARISDQGDGAKFNYGEINQTGFYQNGGCGFDLYRLPTVRVSFEVSDKGTTVNILGLPSLGG